MFTDHQQAGMISCAGDGYLRTPAMDSLAAGGVRFERAYCANPVCLPSRYAMMTGRMPGEVGIRCNFDGEGAGVPAEIASRILGWLMQEAGYDVAYGGKVHLTPGMAAEDMGFRYLTEDQSDGLADACVRFIRADRDRPFMLVASFVNPHDICIMAPRDMEGDEAFGLAPATERRKAEVRNLDAALRMPDGISRQEFFDRLCPPAPANFELQGPEPEAVAMVLDQRPFKRHARDNWTTEEWRMHRWAYRRLTEMVDAHIGRVLEALTDSGVDENTVVIFSTDHGDMDGAYHMEHNTVLYEEATRVPLIVSWKGVTHPGRVDRYHLVSNGLDLLPTVCDYASVAPPDGWRERLHVESEFGHMVAGGTSTCYTTRAGTASSSSTSTPTRARWATPSTTPSSGRSRKATATGSCPGSPLATDARRRARLLQSTDST